MEINNLLFLALIIFLIWLGYKIGSLIKDQEWTEKLPGLRDESVKKSREVLTGQFTEQLAPYMPNFPYSPTECRFIGKPVDFIVFKGMDKGEPTKVVFVEVKSGESKLSSREKKLKEVIEKREVMWEEYRKK